MKAISLLDRLLAHQARRRWRGRHLVRRLLQRHSHVHLIRVETRHGLVLNVDPDQDMDWIVVDSGYYEPEVLDAILGRLERGGVFWDVGANIGVHSITVKHLRPDVTVAAFEPSPWTFIQLSANATLNDIDIQLLNVALSDLPGFRPLSVVVEGNTGLTSLRPWSEAQYTKTILCRCETAESFLGATGWRAPTVVKVDVEGFEREVMVGFGTVLRAPGLHTVIFEAHPDAPGRPPAAPLFSLLREAGFSIAPIAPPSGGPATNFVATR